MKRHHQFLKILLAVLLIGGAGSVSSCKKEVQPPNVTEWVTHQDPINGMEIKYPSGWILNADPKNIKLYSTQEVSGKFYEVYSTGTTEIGDNDGGVEATMAIETFKEVDAGTLDAFKKITLENYAALNLGNEQPVTIGKKEGYSYSYSVKVGKNTTLNGKKMIVEHDSAFYTVSITGFNEYFDVYTPVLEEIVASIILPRPKETFKDPNEASKPSPDVTRYANDFVEFMHPYNFAVTTVGGNKGGAIHTLHLEGLRKDCTIDIDVFPTKTDEGEVKFDRFFEDNKSKFSPKSTKDVKVDGMDAKVITASPAAQIDRKVYFVAKGERIYRVILTWYKPMAADFQPAFEQVVASLKLK